MAADVPVVATSAVTTPNIERVRFAPSPTGQIHIGNARTALYNYALAATTGGSFVLRFDDTDAERSEQKFADQIEADLAWFGIRPDTVVRQSDRLALYDAATERLKAAGLLYPAYETAAELERRRTLQRARGLPPVYDRAALALSQAERDKFEAEGRRPHWRFRLPGGDRSFDDRCRGPVTVHLDTLSDPVLIREDGSYLYTLPSVVDDIELAVTTVVRGEDHVTNTGVQIALFEALGAIPPAFAHHNLLVRGDGEPLSKRDNPLSVARLAAEGFEPMAVASVAVLTGTSQPLEPVPTLDELVHRADLGTVSHGPATFDPADIGRLNAMLVHQLPFEKVEAWLAATFGNAAAERSFWETIRGNLARRADAAAWVSIWQDGPAAEALVGPDDRAFLDAALDGLPSEPWDGTTFRTWTERVRAATGRKGKPLYMPLRVALTGRANGPEMATFIVLLGRSAVSRRLSDALETLPAVAG